MKYFVSFLLLLPFISACNKEKACPRCDTRSEECIDGKCILRDNFVRLRGRSYEKSDIFLGAAQENSCIDSILFSFRGLGRGYEMVITPKTSEPDIFVQRSLVQYPLSDTLFYLPITYFPESYREIFCIQNDINWTATVLTETCLPDSVRMTFNFFSYDLDTIQPPVPIETTTAMLYAPD